MDKNKKLMILLFLTIAFMTLFAFANQELYNLFCQAIGLNVGVEQQDENLVNDTADVTRELNVTFTTESMYNVPVKFSVNKQKAIVNVGYLYENTYKFQNLTNDTLYFRPVHRVYPPAASNHYKMVKCFCFDDMIILPKELLELPLSFLFSSDLDPEVHSVVMHYTLVKREKEDVLTQDEE